MRELATPEVAAVLAELVDAGWRVGQLRHRVGSAPAQAGIEQDAAAVLVLLRGLTDQVCPDLQHAQTLRERELDRADLLARQEPLVEPAAREAYLAEIRSALPGVARRRPEPLARLRPACSVCAGESSYFVTREVHLCQRCVGVLAAGELRLGATG